MLSSIGLIFPQIGAWATDCTPVPDCVSLGYTMSESDCSGVTAIKCPFDTSKLFCQKQTPTPTNNYPCTSEYYVIYSSFPSSFVNECSNSNLAKITLNNPDNLGAMICQKTKNHIRSIPGSAAYGNASACNRAYNNALQSKVIGCCDDTGAVTSLLPSSDTAPAIPIPTYAVGDTLYVNNIPAGTVISLDPKLVLSSKSMTGTYSEVQNFCNNLSTAGLPWGLATPGMMNIINKDYTHIDGCTYYWATGALCYMCGHDIGSCNNSLDSKDQAGGFCVSYF